MNLMKQLKSKVCASGLLMAQLPLASAGLFLDIAHAHAVATPSADSDTVTPAASNLVASEYDATLDNPSLLASESSEETLKASLHPLLEPLTSISRNISKFPLLQPYGSGKNGQSKGALFPLTANYIPSPSPVQANASAVDASEWKSLPRDVLKQWRRPSIEVLTVEAEELGQSLLAEASANGLKKVISKVFPKATVTDSVAPSWNSFCFATSAPQAISSPVPNVHQLVVNQKVVAEFATVAQANLVAKRLRGWMQEKMFSPSELVATVKDGKILGFTQGNVLFDVDQESSQLLGQNRDTIAIAWVNNLRSALGVEPLSLVDAQAKLYGLEKTAETMEGTASWYGPYFHGRQTASGEYFHEGELTVAHKTLPFNTFLKVTNVENDQSVIVRVNDRGPYIGERSLDLSRNAAQCLGSEDDGVIPYEAIVMKPFN